MDNPFYALPGVDNMGRDFGNITVEEAIIGAVRTYLAKGETNGGRAPDPNDREIIDDIYNTNITTPGVICLPIGSTEAAYRAWDQGNSPDTNNANYLCVNYPASDQLRRHLHVRRPNKWCVADIGFALFVRMAYHVSKP